MKGNNYRDFILKFGLITGLVLCVITLFSYMMGLEFMISFWLAFINIAVTIGAVVYCGIVWKRANGGYLDLKNSFLTIFLVYAVSAFIVMLFNITLYTVIDPELPEQVQEAVIEKTIGMMEKFGAPEDKIEETLEKLEEESSEYNASTFISGYFMSLIFGATIALIGGAIIKKQKPIFEEQASDEDNGNF